MLVLLCALLLFSCEKAAETPAVAVVQIDEDDAGIARIAEDARGSLPVFFRYVNRMGAEGEHCYIKCPFAADADSGMGSEQIWLTGVRFRSGRYLGVVVSSPRHLGGMKKGDTVVFNIEAITDWMYVQGGKIIGGESIKYLLESMPEHQRGERERELLGMFH